MRPKCFHPFGWVLFSLASFFTAAARTATPGEYEVELRRDFWVPDGPVYAIAEANGTVYIGGLFDYVSPISTTGSAFDVASGTADPDFPTADGAINVVLPDHQGGWFVGGLFTAMGGVSLSNLAHVRADKTVDADWKPNPNDAVLALAASTDKLYVGGSFTAYGHRRSGPHELGGA